MSIWFKLETYSSDINSIATINNKANKILNVFYQKSLKKLIFTLSTNAEKFECPFNSILYDKWFKLIISFIITFFKRYFLIVDIQNSLKKAKSLVYYLKNKICEIDYVYTNNLELTSEKDAHIMIGYDGDNSHFPKMEIKIAKFFYSNISSQNIIFNKCEKCPSGFFPDLEKKNCVNCHINCQNCIGLGENDCLNCKENKFLFLIDDRKGRCVDSCSGENIQSNLISEVIPKLFDQVEFINVYKILSGDNTFHFIDDRFTKFSYENMKYY